MPAIDTYGSAAPLDGDELIYVVDDPSGSPVDGTVTPDDVGTYLLVQSGTGSPEGVVTATVGNLFLRTDGGADTTLYVKESGASNTGWIAK